MDNYLQRITANIIINKKFLAVIKELFIRRRKLNISLVSITVLFDKDVDNFFLSNSKVLDKYAPRRKKYMLSLIISRLWIKVCLKLLCDEKNFPRVFLKIGPLFHFAVYYFPINGVGYRQDLSSACKSDRADFTDWLSFISFNLMQELNPNPETNA